MPATLLDLLSNSLVLHHTAPYLPVAATFALSRTSKSFRDLVLHTPDVFRYLDLSTVKSAVVPYTPIDIGGNHWRAERMDEALTEDEFYSGPLRGIFSKLERRHLLRNVQTLVLDGLSVPADLVREIIAEDRYSVRVLSIRDVKNLNERKLRQALNYAVRPSRPEGTPRLKALYVFGPRDSTPAEGPPKPTRSPPRIPTPSGVTTSQGAQIGAEWNEKSAQALTAALARTTDKWYQPAGRIFSKRPSYDWADTLQACEGIIYFDAVLCRGPRHSAPASSTSPAYAYPTQPQTYLRPAVASIALGSAGCATCGSCPETPAVFGQSPLTHLPLLSPPPLHASTIRAAQLPATLDGSPPPRLIVRCEDCLRGRWCERCNKWWDEDCYQGLPNSTRTELQQQEAIENMMAQLDSSYKRDVKVHMGLCIEKCYVSEMMAVTDGMWG